MDVAGPRQRGCFPFRGSWVDGGRSRLGATGLQLSGRQIRELVFAGQRAARLSVPVGGEARGEIGGTAVRAGGPG